MGFFSWKTADTKESIANKYTDHPNTLKTIYLLQPFGQKPLSCDEYGGYGDFESCDEYGNDLSFNAYAWLAKANLEHIALNKKSELLDLLNELNISSDILDNISNLDLIKDRETLLQIGLKFEFRKEFTVSFPLKFSFNESACYESYGPSEDCPYQGFFYQGIDI